MYLEGWFNRQAPDVGRREHVCSIAVAVVALRGARIEHAVGAQMHYKPIHRDDRVSHCPVRYRAPELPRDRSPLFCVVVIARITGASVFGGASHGPRRRGHRINSQPLTTRLRGAVQPGSRASTDRHAPALSKNVVHHIQHAVTTASDVRAKPSESA